jgi:hypothetical protein
VQPVICVNKNAFENIPSRMIQSAMSLRCAKALLRFRFGAFLRLEILHLFLNG